MDEVDVQRGLVFQEEFHALMLVGINSIPGIQWPLSARAEFRRSSTTDPANSRRATSRIQRCKVDVFKAEEWSLGGF